MGSRIEVEKSWRQIAAEVAQEDDPQKLSALTEELNRALKRELQKTLSPQNTQAKAA